MGSKNRQGCCCGPSSPKCYNVADICSGGVHAVLYVKNGRVKDDNGEWPLTGSIRAIDGATEWTTRLIKFTTNRWTDGDCHPKNGDAYYYYNVGPKVGFFVIGYATKECGGVTLYTGSEVANVRQVIETSEARVNCDPISVEYDFSYITNPPPPSLKATLMFDVDEDATRSCGCRACRNTYDYPLFSPLGDVNLTYDVDYGGMKKTGVMVLKRMSDSSATLHAPGGGVYLDQWMGDVDWWDEPSCSNPTNSKTGWNVSYGCGATNFLRWCQAGDPPYTRPYLRQRLPASMRSLAFDLVDPGAAVPEQGAITLVDANKDGFDGVCCSPCILPKRDMAVYLDFIHVGSTVPPLSTPLAYSFSATLKYTDAGKSWSYYSTYWVSDTPVSQVYNPLVAPGADYPFHPSDPFDMTTWFKVQKYNIYLSCDGLYYSWIGPNGVDGALQLMAPLDFITERHDAFFPYLTVHADYTCDPFHFNRVSQTFKTDRTLAESETFRVDEVEPDGGPK